MSHNGRRNITNNSAQPAADGSGYNVTPLLTNTGTYAYKILLNPNGSERFIGLDRQEVWRNAGDVYAMDDRNEGVWEEEDGIARFWQIALGPYTADVNNRDPVSVSREPIGAGTKYKVVEIDGARSERFGRDIVGRNLPGRWHRDRRGDDPWFRRDSDPGNLLSFRPCREEVSNGHTNGDVNGYTNGS